MLFLVSIGKDFCKSIPCPNTHSTNYVMGALIKKRKGKVFFYTERFPKGLRPREREA